jgi:type II secretory pathway predicted ATPase ExeA
MFLEFYGLKQEPFGVTPDPRFLFPTPTHREALAALRYGIEAGRGFLALIAPPGMGKTTLLFRLLKHLQGSARTVFLFQTISNPTDLMRYLLQELSLPDGRDLVSMHKELNQVLLSEAGAGRRLVLVIDEAQNLGEPVLEAARVLSNFETPTSKLMQIVLAGQPELSAKLNRPSMSQLRQRISIFTRLEPFKPQETFAYIEHRLTVAGHDGRPIFTRAALELIAEHSEGIPRNINNLCANSLSLGFAVEQALIGPGVVSRVIADLSVPLQAANKTAKAAAAAAGAESGASVLGVPSRESNAPENVLGTQPPRASGPPALEKRPPAAVYEPQPGAASVPSAQEIIRNAVNRIAADAPQAAPAFTPQSPASAAIATAKSQTQEIHLGDRIRWPVSSLTMIGAPAAAARPSAPPAPAPTPQPAATPAPTREPTGASAPRPESSTPLSSVGRAAYTAPAAEPHVREVHLGERFTLRISSPARKSSEPPPPVPEPRARPSTEQPFFSKASWALISLAFLLTLYISTKFWFSEPGEIPSTTPAFAAPPQQAEPSEPMDPIPHVVQQNETLEGIALSYLGYWNPEVRAEVSKLNPHINIRHLRAGQQILIPRKIPDAPPAAIPQTPDDAVQGQVRPYE